MDHKAPGVGRDHRDGLGGRLPLFILLLPTAKLLFYLKPACLIIDKITGVGGGLRARGPGPEK